MLRHLTRAFAPIVSILFAACAVEPPGPDSQGGIEGLLTLENGDPAASALVSAAGRTTTADAVGRFELGPLSDGTYEIELEADAHGLTRRCEVVVSNQEPTSLGEIVLLEEVELAGVLVAGGAELDADRSYTVAADLTIDEGSTLQLAPGTRLVLGAGAELLIEGVILAESDETPIEITGAEAGDGAVLLETNSGPHRLRGVRFSDLYEGVSLANNVDATIDACSFTDMGRVAVYSSGSPVTLTNSNISNSTYGVELFDALSSSIISCVISNCAQSGIVLSNSEISVADCRFLDCTVGIEISYNSVPAIVHNLFEGNAVCIGAAHCSVAPNGMLVEWNEFRETTDIDVRLSHNCFPLIGSNNFSSSSAFALSTPKNARPDSIDAVGNYWGTADAGRVPARIYDDRAVADLAPVRYRPFSLSSLSDTGPR